MKKRTYQSKEINQINWECIKKEINGEPVVFAVDVAKTMQFALLGDEHGRCAKIIRWEHPQETDLMLTRLEELECPVTVVMESTSTYGDPIRYQCRERGFDIHQASAKRVHDAKEVYDGVPSMHDAKSATVIARFYWDGLTTPWQELNTQQRELNSLAQEYDLHQSQHLRNLNKLEACLGRHWPGVTTIIGLDSVTLEQLLIEYGSPKQVARHRKEAEQLIRKASRNMLKPEKIQQVLDSASTTLGVPCTQGETHLIQTIAREMMHNRIEKKRAKEALQRIIEQEEPLTHMAKLIGRVTTAILLSLHLDPRDYHCAQSYLKALGLNLKEKSSGRYVGQLKITKRGSDKARQYLYFAALRLTQSCPTAKQWYDNKKTPNAKKKAVIAVMRKLAGGLWHVARGEAYAPTKLFNVSGKAA